MESVEEMKKNKPINKIERVVLDTDVFDLVEKQRKEFNSKSVNTKLNLKQFVNYMLLKRCSIHLKEDEIAEMNIKFYDPVLVAKLAYKKALEAKKQGRQFTQDEMIQLYQTQSVSSDRGSKKTRGRKKKTNTSSLALEQIRGSQRDSLTPEASQIRLQKAQHLDSKSENNDVILSSKSP